MATEGKRDYTHLLKHSLIQTQDQWVQPMGAIPGKWGSQGHGAWVRALMQRAAGSRCARPGGGELGRDGRRAVRPAAPPSWSSRLWRRRARGG